MVISQWADNFFGYSEEYIEVRKEVMVEDKTPLILRHGDTIELGANVFNTTDSEIWFKATLTIQGTENTKPEQEFSLEWGESKFITWKVKNTSDCLSLEENCLLPYTISVLGDSASRSDKLEGSIEIAPAPAIMQNNRETADVRTWETKTLTLETTENTDINKSQYYLSVSNDPFLGIENIFRSLVRYPYGCIEQTLSSTLPNAIAKRLSNMFADSDIKPERVDQNLERGLEKILAMQLDNGGFGYWRGDTFAELAITPYVLRTLTQLKNAGVEVPEEVLEKTAEYLIKNTPLATKDIQIEIIWALAEYKGVGVKEIYESLDIDLATRWNINELSYHDLVSYTYALVLTDRAQYKETIDRAIALLLEGKPEENYQWYYSAIEDKALLAQLLIEYDYDAAEVTDLIVELYGRNWKSYWYSTKSKNAAFLAFTRYMEVYGSEYKNTVGFSFNGTAKDVSIDSENGVLESVRILAEVLSGEQVSLEVENKQWIAPIFVTSEMDIYPLDPLAVKPFSNGMTIKREIYEVTDESQLEEKCTWDNWSRNCVPAKGLKLHTGDEFKKWVSYKIKLLASIDDKRTRENFTMEDYLPAGFTILNSRFKTNTIATAQASSWDRWRWSHTEKRPQWVMAHARYSWGRTAEYEYFVRADFAGEFIYPPVAAYMMYQPTKRANNEFRRIVIK